MKTKAHTRYKLEDGTIVVGCTTVVNQLAKPALVGWANRLGLDGYDVNKYVDDLANVGSLAHEMVSCHFSGKKLNTNDYTANEIKRAKNAFKSFTTWIKSQNVKPIIHEQELVSEKYKFGGTPDLLAEIDGVNWLIDFKTGSGIYDDYIIQLAGYALILEDRKIDKVAIVRIGRTGSEGFETKTLDIADISLHKEVFLNLLKVYNLQKDIRWQKKK